MFVFLIIIAIFLCLVHIVLNYNETARIIKKIPGPKDRFIVGNGLEIIVPPIQLWNLGREYTKKFKGIFRFYSFPVAAVNIYNPEDIEIVISTMKHHEKSSLYSFLKPWLRDGLLVSSGSKWQQRRKILTSAFHFNILQKFCVVLEDNSRRLVDTLEKSLGEHIDIVPIMSDFTLYSICETAMGTKLAEEETDAVRAYKNAIFELGKLLVHRFCRVYLFTDFIYNLTSLSKRQKKYLDTVHNFTGKVIKDRKESVEKHIDDDVGKGNANLYHKQKKIAMLDLLISAEKDGLIDNAGIQEEVDTFMFEGHDTTASALTFCLMAIANKKDIQDKIRSELHEIFDYSMRPATIEDLSRMRYLDCCIKESLRLYPPVNFISRRLSETVKLSNYTVPVGTFCHIHIYDLHRREDLFENSTEFDPDRFLPQNSIGRHPYAYIPFSAGPRNCIGQKFAMLEMKFVLSAILRKFELVPVTKPSDLQIEPHLVLKNFAPIYVKFVKNEDLFSLKNNDKAKINIAKASLT